MEPPPPPDESDCCNSGCNPCILDIYEEQLKKFKANQANLAPKSGKNCISQTAYTIFKCVDKINHTETAYLYVFEYYKPFRESAVKLYEGGVMSRYLRRINVGSETLWRGPYCDFEIDYSYKFILMVAQGTGIAPLYAILKEMLNNEECESFIKLFYCCRSGEDIFLREDLYGCLSYWNFTYEVFLSQFKGVTVKYNEVIHDNRLDKGCVRSYLSDKADNTSQILICGSDVFNRDLTADLGDLNVHVYSF
ncbi:Oxidoreductase-like protein, N-terminal [Popillia japonica]|uniref:cytochrome-b5 reductase n=1 Tax=Popillia japonica TaxID=7064 RepID=A0AAW1N7I1_POPJA